MSENSKLPPGREPLRSDWFMEQLGASNQKVMSLNQKVMSLTVQVHELKKRGKAEVAA